MFITLPINSRSSLFTRLLPLRDQLVSNCDLLENRGVRARGAETAPITRARARAHQTCIRRALERGCGQWPQPPGRCRRLPSRLRCSPTVPRVRSILGRGAEMGASASNRQRGTGRRFRLRCLPPPLPSLSSYSIVAAS